MAIRLEKELEERIAEVRKAPALGTGDRASGVRVRFPDPAIADEKRVTATQEEKPCHSGSDAWGTSCCG